MFSYFKSAVYNSVPAKEYLKSRNLDYNKLDIGYNSAYDRSLNKMGLYTLEKNLKLTNRNDLLQDNISYEDGMKLIDGTWNMTTLKFAPTNSMIKNMAIKIPMKAGFKGAINFMNGW